MSDGAVTFDIVGLDQAMRDLVAAAEKLGLDGSTVEVAWRFGGPAAPYAVYVHEDMEADHSHGNNPVGQARFMASVLEEDAPRIAQDIVAGVQAGDTLPQAVRGVAEEKMTKMKERTPVEYGTLRDGGHVVQGTDGL